MRFDRGGIKYWEEGEVDRREILEEELDSDAVDLEGYGFELGFEEL